MRAWSTSRRCSCAARTSCDSAGRGLPCVAGRPRRSLAGADGFHGQYRAKRAPAQMRRWPVLAFGACHASVRTWEHSSVARTRGIRPLGCPWEPPKRRHPEDRRRTIRTASERRGPTLRGPETWTWSGHARWPGGGHRCRAGAARPVGLGPFATTLTPHGPRQATARAAPSPPASSWPIALPLRGGRAARYADQLQALVCVHSLMPEAVTSRKVPHVRNCACESRTWTVGARRATQSICGRFPAAD